MSVRLVKMSCDIMHAYFNSFAYDPFMFQENENTPTYIYDLTHVNQSYREHLSQGKLHFAIFHNSQIVGDIYLKDIDMAAQTCEMGIHIVNDNYKGKGYGIKAEKILLHYAFAKLHLKTVYAKELIKNTRSIHVQKKVGFVKINRNEPMVRFECQKSTWNPTACLDKPIIT